MDVRGRLRRREGRPVEGVDKEPLPLRGLGVSVAEAPCEASKELSDGKPAQSISRLADRGRVGAPLSTPPRPQALDDSRQAVGDVQVAEDTHGYDQPGHDLGRKLLGLAARLPELLQHLVDKRRR